MIGSLFRYLRRHHIGLLALVIAMGGTAYAAGTVNGRDIVDGSLKGKDLRNGTVQGRDIQSEALNGSHIDESTLDDPAASATVAGENDPRFLENEGFVPEVRRTAPGTYELSLEEPRDCSFTGSPYGLIPEETGDGGTIAVAYAPGELSLTAVVRDSSGKPVDLGAGKGPFGFTIVSGC